MTTTSFSDKSFNRQIPSKYQQLTGFGAGNLMQVRVAKLNLNESVLVMAVFLLLGSIAVVAITRQFPWFMLAPSVILLSFAYLRHAEKRHQQDH